MSEPKWKKQIDRQDLLDNLAGVFFFTILTLAVIA